LDGLLAIGRLLLRGGLEPGEALVGELEEAAGALVERPVGERAEGLQEAIGI
jgi:hypothetical protein